jgi:hypothetical protein
MEDLQEEVDALFEASDARYFEMFHKIANIATESCVDASFDEVDELPHISELVWLKPSLQYP